MAGLNGVLAMINDPGRCLIPIQVNLGASGALASTYAGRGWYAAKTGTGTYTVTLDETQLGIEAVDAYIAVLNQDTVDPGAGVQVTGYSSGVLSFTTHNGTAAANLAAGSVDILVVARTDDTAS